eukprot:gene8097-biopygen10615
MLCGPTGGSRTVMEPSPAKGSRCGNYAKDPPVRRPAADPRCTQGKRGAGRNGYARVRSASVSLNSIVRPASGPRPVPSRNVLKCPYVDPFGHVGIQKRGKTEKSETPAAVRSRPQLPAAVRCLSAGPRCLPAAPPLASAAARWTPCPKKHQAFPKTTLVIFPPHMFSRNWLRNVFVGECS